MFFHRPTAWADESKPNNITWSDPRFAPVYAISFGVGESERLRRTAATHSVAILAQVLSAATGGTL